MNYRLVLAVLVACAGLFCNAQDYAEYARGRGRAKRGGGGGWLIPLAAAVGGTVAGGWIQQGRMKKRHEKEKKDLLKYIQSIDDVYKQRETQWQTEYQKLYKAYESLETDTIKRDYEEFKAPDTDGDDQVSREEFAIYVRKYLSSFPELSEKDFPKFDEFDLNGDGIVSFAEWQQFLKQQKLKEASGGGKGGEGGAYTDLLNALYADTYSSSNFETLSTKSEEQRRGKRRA